MNSSFLSRNIFQIKEKYLLFCKQINIIFEIDIFRVMIEYNYLIKKKGSKSTIIVYYNINLLKKSLKY